MVGEVAGQEIQHQDPVLEELDGAFHGAMSPHVGDVHVRIRGQAVLDPAQVFHQLVEGQTVGDHHLNAHVHAMGALEHNIEKPLHRGGHAGPVAGRDQAEQARGILITRPGQSLRDVGRIALAGQGSRALDASQAVRDAADIRHQGHQQHQGQQKNDPPEAGPLVFLPLPRRLFPLPRPRRRRLQVLVGGKPGRHQLLREKRVTYSGSQFQ